MPTKVRILLQAEEVQLPAMDHHLPWIRHLSRKTTDKQCQDKKSQGMAKANHRTADTVVFGFHVIF